jgi:transposase InsO family protein
MKLHGNAKTTPLTRALLVQRLEAGWSAPQVAEAHGLSVRTVYGWWARYRQHGAAGLRDRSSRPHRLPRQVPAACVVAIIALRRQRLTGWQIAQRLQMAPSTVAAVLTRVGLARLALLAPPKPPPVRYERAHAGELVHLDVKPLGRIGRVGHRIHGDRRQRVAGIGWEYTHVAVDDASRLAYAEVLADQKGVTAVAFVERARQWFWRAHGIRIQQVMTDNGSAYVSRKFRQALKRHGIRHLRTRPYRPETNGKAERFIQTMLLGWAYKRAYAMSLHRTKALAPWLRFYNERRPHRSLGMMAPALKLRLVA